MRRTSDADAAASKRINLAQRCTAVHVLYFLMVGGWISSYGAPEHGFVEFLSVNIAVENLIACVKAGQKYACC